MTLRPFALALLAALLGPIVAQAQGTSASKAAVGVQRPPAQVAPAQAAQPAPNQPSQPGAQSTAPAQVPPAFTAFLQELWPDARAKGVTRATFDMAFAGVTPDPRIMPITQRQPEFGQSVGTYIANFASKSRIETGMRKAAEHAATLDAVEKRYGVDRYLLLAIWGVETNFGGMRDRDRTLHDGARAHFFGRCEAACIRHDELRVDDHSVRTTKCLRRHDTPSAGA